MQPYKEEDSARPIKYMVCHDGSQNSEYALQTVAHGFLRDMDKLMIGHAWSREKEEYLAFNFKRDYV